MAERKRPSMHDVARRAGVSQTTVSLVLNNPENSGIPQATQERVLAAVQAVGYRPNRLARAMRLKRTETLGFVSENIATTPFATKMIKGAQDAAWEAGHLLLIFDTGAIDNPNHGERERLAVEQLLERHVDGIVLASMYHRVFEPPPGLDEVPSVLVDLRAERRLHHLRRSRRTRCGLRRHNPPDRTRPHENRPPDHRLPRRRGGQAAPGRIPGRTLGSRRRFQCRLCHHRAIPHRGRPRGGTTAARACPNPRRPSSASTTSRQWVSTRPPIVWGSRSPTTCPSSAFDDQDLIAAELLPGLTTMALPHYEMGYWAVEHLLTKPAPDQAAQHTLPCHLIERGSVAPPNPR